MKLFSRRHLVVSCIILGVPVAVFLGMAIFAPYYRELVFTEGSPVRYLIFPAFLWHLLGFLLFTVGILMLNYFTGDDPIETRRRTVLTIVLVILEVLLVTFPVLLVLLVGPHIFMFLMFWGH